MREQYRYGIHCQNQSSGVHTIQIPPPKLFGTGVNPSKKAKDIVSVNLLCPYCKHVYVYTAREIRERLFRKQDQDLVRSEPICVAVEFVCGEGDCRSRLTVHAMKYELESNAVAVAQLKQAIFHVSCHFGHTPRFDPQRVVHCDDIGPFSPF
jgi:hypothetical protein